MHGVDEALHFIGGNCHGGAVGFAFHVAVLQRGRLEDNGVKSGAGGVDKEEVGDEWSVGACLFSSARSHLPVHGSESGDSQMWKGDICGREGVWTLEVAQHEPL